MSVQLNPYIHFSDNAREAMEFYKTIFGGELTLTTFGEGGMPHSPAETDKIMHGQLNGDNGVTFMGADTPSDMDTNPGNTISMTLSGDDEALLSGYFQQLGVDGNTHVPLDKAPWGDSFGMLSDKFGIEWMVNITGTAS